MIFNGEIGTSSGTIYTVPASTDLKTINLFRVVNNSAGARTFTIYLNVNGTKRALTPISTQLPIGAAWDDQLVFQMPKNSTIEAVASDTEVEWTINAQ